jgi:long-subunit acyl-CoA synthetase (AMP-forming)
VIAVVSIMMSLAPIAYRAIAEDHAINEDDAYLAFLPLAHVLEMLAELMLLMGIKLRYSGANTVSYIEIRAVLSLRLTLCTFIS